MQEAGFPPIPVWQPPDRQLPPGDPHAFRLLRGHQAMHTHGSTDNNAYLMGITHRGNSARLWINTARASQLGIGDGAWVVVENDQAKGTIQAHVTQGLHPEAVWLPAGYGSTNTERRVAQGVGISPNEFAEIACEPISGHAMMQEVIVRVRRADPAEAKAATTAAGAARQRWQQAARTWRRATT